MGPSLNLNRPGLRPAALLDRSRAAKGRLNLRNTRRNRQDKVAEQRRFAVFPGVFMKVPVVRVLRPGRMMSRRRAHSARVVQAADTQGLGGTARPWSERQNDLPAVPAPEGRVNVSQASGVVPHDAVVAVSNVTALTPITPMGNVAASDAVAGASAVATRAAASVTIGYEMAPSKMAASRAATPGVAAASTTAATTVASATSTST